MSDEMSGDRSPLVPASGTGRVFRTQRTVSIDDADARGRMEIDAIANFLQDAGNDDTDNAGLAELGLAWVARRMTIDVFRFPQSRDRLDIATWCSGTGRRWAERRTTMQSESGGHVEAAAIWIHVDGSTGAPVPWGEDFANTYLEAAGDRKVAARLSLPKAPNDSAEGPLAWSFRKTDTDAFDHVNNAAYLAVVEEFTVLDEGPYRIELEWRTPTRHTEPVEIYRWSDPIAAKSDSVPRGSTSEGISEQTDTETTVWITVMDETRAVARIQPM